MLKKIIGVLLGLIVFQTGGYANITIGIPHDTLYAGSKGTQRFVPVMVDSIGQEDSVGGYQLQIIADSTRLQFIGYITDGTLSSSNFTIWSSNHGNDSAYLIGTVTNSLPMIGSGPLIYLVYEVISDTAGEVPVRLDTIYTQFAKVTGDLSTVGLDFKRGSVTFIPTMGLGIESNDLTVYSDTVITVPIMIGNVRGDRIKSAFLHFRSGDQRLSFAGTDSSGTLLGEFANEGSYFAGLNADGTLSVSAMRDSIKDGEIDSSTVLKIKLLLHGKASFTGTVVIDSVVINGFAEPFKISNDTISGVDVSSVLNDTGRYNVTVIQTEVSEPTVGRVMDFELYPNPVNDILNIRSSKNDNAIRYNIGLFDEKGSRVMVHAMNRDDFQMDLSRYDLPNGAYTVQIYGDNKIFSKRILFLH